CCAREVWVTYSSVQSRIPNITRKGTVVWFSSSRREHSIASWVFCSACTKTMVLRCLELSSSGMVGI
ncbi:hypothetical protein A2U01_0083196, partial [Trifolium medium]|nr:hypothetical protein [Trifolium medium]